MIEKIKVVSSSEISRIEKLACLEGCREDDFMEKAGRGVADRVESFVQKENLERTVTLLTGKGNNAGDAYVAGSYLIGKGFTVRALSVYQKEEVGPLCHKQLDRFLLAGGKVNFLKEQQADFPSTGVLLDGLVGTGFSGAAHGELADAINLANKTSLPILSIDVPSGLCASTGRVETVAIHATATIYLEFPKIGFFLEKGPDYTGLLWKETFGLPTPYQEKINPEAYLVEITEGKKLLPLLYRTRNKYSAGYIGVVAGSPAMQGAGALASYAALRSGAGIVRWFYSGSFTPHGKVPLELIASSLQENWGVFEEEKLRMSSLLIGPGLGRDEEVQQIILKALSSIPCPVVLDADALYFLSQHPSFPIPKKAVLTPHKGELKRLLEGHKLEGSFFTTAQALAEKTQTTLLVKGAPNFLFTTNNLPYILPCGNPGMATAGSGDVLSGIIASLLAQKMGAVEATLVGCFLHGLAGDIAAEEKTPYCLIASDIIEYLPKAFRRLF